MSAADLIPGLRLWRAGRRAPALLVGLPFLAGLILAVGRHARLGAVLTGRALETGPPLADLRVGALSLALLLVALYVGSFVLSRRPPTSSRFLAAFLATRSGPTGLALVLGLAILALLAPLVAPYDPDAFADIVAGQLLAPSTDHLLGTDRLSRDVLSRLVYGARVSLLVSILSVVIAVSLGTVYGALAGTASARVDAWLMRALDVLLAVPGILLVISAASIWGSRSLGVLSLVIGLLAWMVIARLVRGQVLSLKEREHFLAARALGAGPLRLFAVHLLPQVAGPLLVHATLAVGNVILLEASLSYLGFGVAQPTASWGSMIFDNQEAIFDSWWVPFAPGLAIVLAVVGYNLLGDGLREALDPRQSAALRTAGRGEEIAR